MNMKIVMLGALASAFLAVGCSKSSDSAAASGGSTTWALSGTMGGLSRVANLESESQLDLMGYMKNQAITLAASIGGQAKVGTGGGVTSQSSACSDGKYYRVLCSAWSVPPVAAYGDVSCGGANSGSFTVSGLPLNTDISCAIRKSTDGSSFTPFANIELPAKTTIGGGVSTINASGNMALTITVGSNGTITTEVTSGDNKADDSASATVTPSSISGFYNMSCDAALGADNFKMCKCFLFYQSGNPGDCVNNGSHTSIPDSSAMTINFNVYKGMSGSSGIDFGHGDVFPANTAIYAGTVWAANNGGNACTSAGSCTSMRSGAGEGLPLFTGLTWEDSAAAAALTWTTGTVSLKCGSGNANVTVGAIPNSSATRANWLTWLQNIVQSYDTACSTAFMGCNASDGSWHTDPFCVGNFTWNVLDQAENVNLPRLRWDFSNSHTCDNTGCTANSIAANMLMVEGVDFNSSGAVEHYMPSPRNRYVFDQFLPNSSGNGGSLKSKGEDMRGFQCSSPPSGVTCSDAATTANAWVECRSERVLNINFIPDGSGNFNMVFDEKNSVRDGKYKGGSVNNTDAYSVCAAYLASDVSPQFMTKATKLQ
jgi:hypothetical protein